MCFWINLCSIYNLFTEPGGCLVQIDHLIVFAQQAQMDVYTSISPGAHLMTQLVDRVKCNLSPECHAWPRRVSPPIGEAQLAGCLEGLTSGPLEWDTSIQ